MQIRLVKPPPINSCMQKYKYGTRKQLIEKICISSWEYTLPHNNLGTGHFVESVEKLGNRWVRKLSFLLWTSMWCQRVSGNFVSLAVVDNVWFNNLWENGVEERTLKQCWENAVE